MKTKLFFSSVLISLMLAASAQSQNITLTNQAGRIKFVQGVQTIYIPKVGTRVTYKSSTGSITLLTTQPSGSVGSSDIPVVWSLVTTPATASPAILADTLAAWIGGGDPGVIDNVSNIESVDVIDEISDTVAVSVIAPQPEFPTVEYTSPWDFAAAYTSGSSITLTGTPFTVDDANCVVLGIMWKTVAGVWHKITNGFNGVNIGASSNVLTVSGSTVAFVATDLQYRVSVFYQKKAYDATTNSMYIAEVAPLNEQFASQVLSDSTNVGAAGSITYYIPSTSGISMDGYKDVSLQLNTTGGVTTTIEAHLDDSASPTWVDITKTAYNNADNTYGNASYIDAATVLSLNNLNVKAIRIKRVTTDATNKSFYTIRQKAL